MNQLDAGRWLRAWLVLLACCWPLLGQAQPPLYTFTETYHAPPTPKALRNPQPQLSQPDPNALTIQLPAPPASAWQASKNNGKKALAIGIGQTLPAPYDHPIDGNALTWTQLAEGGWAATIEVSSAGAAGLRLQLRVAALPDGAELRFFAPDAAGQASVVTALELPRNQPYWSPSVVGDTLVLEIDLPAGADPGAVQLTLPQLSYLRVSPRSSSFVKSLNELGNSGSCEIDVACNTLNVPQSIIDSVAHYIFTGSDGQTYLCSGTLLSDTDPSTQIPYFLTAHHCVSQPSEAASMEFYWFFQRAYCGGPAPTQDITTNGGAALLSTGAATDYTLVRLNQPPPDGVGMAGWSTRTPAPGDAVFGIHHPMGDLKKISVGTVQQLVPVVGRGIGPNYIQVVWSQGATEPGSSGSGLWDEATGEPLLVGNELGGTSSCQAPHSPDYYGRFDLTFPSISSYLVTAKAIDNSPRLLNISTNGYVDSSQGMIAGFIVTGGAKRFAIMGEDVGGLADPEIQVESYPDGTIIGTNDNWQEGTTGAEVASELRPPGAPQDAALALTLGPGQYIAILRDKTGQGGRGLLSVTEINGGVGGRLLNISTNGYVDNGQGMIAGFTVTGGAKRFAIMGENMSGLADPEIQVESFPDDTVIGANDNWQDSPTGQEVANKLRPPAGPNDAALALTLEPGQYIAILRDKTGHGGRGIVSVTEISQ